MEISGFLEQLGVMVAGGAIALIVARMLRLPGVVAYLVAGCILGPITGIVDVGDNHDLDWILETGISLMLFLVGLEMSPELVRHLKGKPLMTGLVQVLVMLLAGLGVLMLQHHNVTAALTGGLALALSSTIVVLKLLQDRKETRTAFGQLALAILLTQDLVVIVGLTLLESRGAGGSSEGVLVPILKTVGAFGLVLGVCYIAWKILLQSLFRWDRATPDLLMVFSLAWCFGIVYVAHHLHLSAESGAFLAGLSLAGLPHSEDLRRRVHPLMQFFIAIFFVSLATGMEFGIVSQRPVEFGVLLAFIIVVKPLMMLGLFRLMRWRKSVAPRTALILGQISEFSLIFMTLAAEKGAVPEWMGDMFLVLALASIPVSIIIFQLIFRGGRDSAAQTAQERNDHIIVIGMNTLGRRIASRFHERGEKVIVVDTDPRKMVGLSCEKVIGSTEHHETLEEINLSGARLVVSALRIEESNELIAYWCQRKGVKACIHAVDMNNLDRLLDMKVAYLILPKVDGIRRQVEELQKKGLLGT